MAGFPQMPPDWAAVQGAAGRLGAPRIARLREMREQRMMAEALQGGSHTFSSLFFFSRCVALNPKVL